MFEKAINDIKDLPKYDEVFWQFGPMDGGCLIFAKAMLLAFGPGKLARITRQIGDNENWYSQTEHYGVVLGDWIYDAEGAYPTPTAWVERFAEAELLPVKRLGVAVGFDEDSQITDDAASSKMLAKLLAESIGKVA